MCGCAIGIGLQLCACVCVLFLPFAACLACVTLSSLGQHTHTLTERRVECATAQLASVSQSQSHSQCASRAVGKAVQYEESENTKRCSLLLLGQICTCCHAVCVLRSLSLFSLSLLRSLRTSVFICMCVPTYACIFILIAFAITVAGRTSTCLALSFKLSLKSARGQPLPAWALALSSHTHTHTYTYARTRSPRQPEWPSPRPRRVRAVEHATIFGGLLPARLHIVV